MSEIKKSKKELRMEIKKEVEADKKARKKRIDEINALSEDKRKDELEKYKKSLKKEKADRKKEIKNITDKKEKKVAKKHDKIYKKTKNRTRSTIIKIAILLVVASFIVYMFPLFVNISDLLTSKHLKGLTSGTPEAIAAKEAGEEIAAEIPDEGMVLLKNEGNLLPFKDKKVNIFGYSTMNLLYGGFGSGAADYSAAIDLKTGFRNAGIEYNEDLVKLYDSFKSDDTQNKSGALQILSQKANDEPESDYLTDEVLNSAKEFSDVAIISFSSTAAEAMDFSFDNLKLTENKIALLNKVTENFDNVIVLINSGNVMDLSFLEEYPQIKAAIWIGYPGNYGCNTIGKIITGELNPSGRLVDTYPYNLDEAPANVSIGNNEYTNLEKETFINYYEGIYVGYRYFETYYLNDEAGYNNAVQYPFGYGLSYTDFTWELVDKTFDDNKISLEVKVTNNGEYPGKDVVQAYFTPPYTDLGIEKSAIELAAYEKTGVINKGESENVTITFNTRDMSSYDMNEKQAYVLEKGNYEIKLGKNVHDIVITENYEVEKDVIYETDDVTNIPYKNRFDEAKGEIEYLSRSDFDGTFPSANNINYVAPDYLIEDIKVKFEKTAGEMPVLEADNGIKFSDLNGLKYEDPKWEEFIDQFSAKELENFVINGAYKTAGIERLGLPSTILMDGPAGLNYFFGDSVDSASYPSEIMISSSWNDELAQKMGAAVGNEAKTYGAHGWYAPAMNIHRTSRGGRNFEYFSEDPVLSGRMSAAMTRGAQSQDIIVFMKHFVINDQETNARSGLITWVNEQALREIYLRPFEITVKDGGATGAMSSFPRLGATWVGGNKAVLKGVLRDEWGFKGVVSSDAAMRIWPHMDVYEAITSGNDLMLDVMPTLNKRYLRKNYNKDEIGIINGLKYSAKNICYAIAQTYVMDDIA